MSLAPFLQPGVEAGLTTATLIVVTLLFLYFLRRTTWRGLPGGVEQRSVFPVHSQYFLALEQVKRKNMLAAALTLMERVSKLNLSALRSEEVAVANYMLWKYKDLNNRKRVSEREFLEMLTISRPILHLIGVEGHEDS